MKRQTFVTCHSEDYLQVPEKGLKDSLKENQIAAKLDARLQNN